MRSFDYIKDYGIIPTTIKGYIKTLKQELEQLINLEKDPVYSSALAIIKNFEDKYPDLYEIHTQILNDLLSPKNVEYCFKYQKYPEDASKIGMEFERDLKKIFILEITLKEKAALAYQTRLTPFENITNGEDFIVVGHCSYLLPGTKEDNNYRKGPYSKQYLSCLLLSNLELNTFMGIKTAYIVEVNKENYISSSSFDSATRDRSTPSFHTLKKIEENGHDHYIDIGYTIDYKKAVTSISTPNLIEKSSIEREVKEKGELFNYDNVITNEVVLDRTKSKVQGALLISSGCDLLIDEYLELKQNHIPFKCINKGLYREKYGLPNYTIEEFIAFTKKMQRFRERINSRQISLNILLDYYNEVVIPMMYDDKILDIIKQEFSTYIQIPGNVPKL